MSTQSDFELREQPVCDLEEHLAISCAFETSVVHDPVRLAHDGRLVEQHLPVPVAVDARGAGVGSALFFPASFQALTHNVPMRSS